MEHMKQMQRYQSQKLISRRTFGTQQQIRVQEKIKQQLDKERKQSMFKAKEIEKQIQEKERKNQLLLQQKVQRLQSANLNKDLKVKHAIDNMVQEIDSLELKLNKKQHEVELKTLEVKLQQQEKIIQQKSLKEIKRELAEQNKQEHERRQKFFQTQTLHKLKNEDQAF